MAPYLPVKLKPKQGESLFSYLMRLSDINKLPFLTLLNLFRKSENYYLQRSNVDLLCYFPDRFLDISALAQATNASVEKIKGCSFHRLIEQFSVQDDLGRTRLLSGYLRKTLHYCPDCVKEDPFYHLSWKMENVELCLNHHCFLSKHCLHCHRDIRYKNVVSIQHCPHCANPLASRKGLEAPIPPTELERGKWIQEQWRYLMREEGKSILTIQEISIRLLYLLNGERSDQLWRESIQLTLDAPLKLQKLLQHARGTIPTTRTLHLSFLFSILFRMNQSFQYLFQLEVPTSFLQLLHEKEPQPTANHVPLPARRKPVQTGSHRQLFEDVLEAFLKKGEKITVNSVSTHMGVSKSTIRNWGEAPSLPSIKGSRTFNGWIKSWKTFIKE